MVQEDQLDSSQSIGVGVTSTLRVCLCLARLSLTAFDWRERGFSPLKGHHERRESSIRRELSIHPIIFADLCEAISLSTSIDQFIQQTCTEPPVSADLMASCDQEYRTQIRRQAVGSWVTFVQFFNLYEPHISHLYNERVTPTS